jgi:hypothetical protein
MAGINETPGDPSNLTNDDRDWPTRECPKCNDKFLNLALHLPTCDGPDGDA